MSAPRRWLKISGMYIFPVLQLKVGLLILIWMASLATCYLSWSIILEVEDVGSGVVAGDAVFVNCTADKTIVFFYSQFPNIHWIPLCKKGYNFLLGRTICRLRYVLLVMEFYC